MVTDLTASKHRSVSDLERDKAWHLLHLLFTIGHPVLPSELAAKCRLFTVSADFVEYLCSIPGSPLLLTEGHFVTVSESAFFAFKQFALKAVGDFVPRIPPRVYGTSGLCDGIIRTYYRKRKELEDDSLVLPTAKRRLILPSESDDDNQIAHFTSKFQASPTGQTSVSNGKIGNKNLLANGASVIDHDSRVLTRNLSMVPLVHVVNLTSPSNASGNTGYVEDSYEGEAQSVVHKESPQAFDIQKCQHNTLNNDVDLKIPKASVCKSGEELNLPSSARESSMLHRNLKNETTFVHERALNPTTCQEAETRHDASPVKTDHTNHVCRTVENRVVGEKIEFCCQEQENIMNSGTPAGGKGDLVPAAMAAVTLLKNGLSPIYEISNEDKVKSLTGEETAFLKVDNKTLFPSADSHTVEMQPTKPSAKLKNTQRDSISLGPKVTHKMLDACTAVPPKQQEMYKKDRKCISIKEKLKKSLKVPAKENRTNPTSTDPKNHLETKALPDFESFVIEEEEGSGGYGTVYRALRKSDGKTFAIKCPHANAHTHHVNNELKMLELFGGQNFVIKFEGSFKSNNSECFVLEHVDHDRPEVLKKEIDIFQLQWYGYCMFKALSSLHKQGVVHRDVKPGNFLFSRALSKGYLIDFNLAMDLHKKYGTTSKTKTYSTSFNHIPLPSTESAPPTKGRKVTGNRALEAARQEVAKDSKLPFEPKNIKKRADVGHLKSYPDLGSRAMFKNQGADGSGITSTKEATSTRTPSAERLREPLPYSSRKELNRLVQEAMGNPDQKAVRIPASQRKRVAAPPGKVDRKLYLTPMPLHSSGIAISGAGVMKNKGDVKHKREGPCVGTKGFRAPEVLLRSPHQGFKVDVWSAGVTLLYLIIGRTPFTGDPEQNIKEISKLKGSEDLWEVAKLHNRESSFPVELFDVNSLPSTNLRDWCEENTKRPEFLDMIPSSLFDLVEKCLTVNPRLRISAEDALRHEFFRRCHEDLRKKRLMRKVSLDSGSAHLGDVQLESEVKVLHKENLAGVANA